MKKKNENSTEENACENEFIDENKETRCQTYIKFATERESIKINETKEFSIHPLNERIIIYYNYEDEITNENKLELGYIDSPLSELPLINRNLKVTMKFSNYINVTIIDETENKENSVLLSYPINKFFEINEYTKINKDCNIIIDTKENMTRYQNYQNSKFINIGFLMIICLILTL